MENDIQQNMSNGMKGYWANMTPEERSLRNKESAKKRKSSYLKDFWSAYHRGEAWAVAKHKENVKFNWAKLTPEERAARIEKIRNKCKDHWSKLTPEEREVRIQKNRDSQLKRWGKK